MVRSPRPGSPCWVDGERLLAGEAALALSDPALLAGYGLFETIAARSGRLLELDAHLSRLERGAERLGLDPPPRAVLRERLAAAAAELGGPCGWVKLIVTGGGRWVVLGDEMDPAEEGAPARAVLLPWRRSPRDPLVDLKTLSHGHNLLGLAAARTRGADEGLWLNARGHLAEGCSSNLFVVHGRRIFTPGEGEGILPGVVRGLAISAARELGLVVHEGKVRLRRLEQAREAFLTSSLRRVRPLVSFEGRPVGLGRAGPVTRSIAAEVARRGDRG